MTLFAYFDPTWPEGHLPMFLDTNLDPYVKFPVEHRIPVTDEQWADRMNGHWTVKNGVLTKISTSPHTIEHPVPVAQVDPRIAELEARIAALETTKHSM